MKWPTLIIADNASVPLRVKLDRLEKYAKAGDVIILPLEWIYYKRETIPKDFLDNIMKEFSTYYFAMPIHEQFKFFMGSINLDQITSGIWKLIDTTPKLDQRKSHELVMSEKFDWAGVTKNPSKIVNVM